MVRQTRLEEELGFGRTADLRRTLRRSVRNLLCENGQGGRGKGDAARTFGIDGNQNSHKGVRMSLWINDLDATFEHCKVQNIEVTWPQTDMPWDIREMHVRHPDGHVLRLSQAIQEEPE